MSKGKKSPCVDVCSYRGPNGWCTACGLTIKESRGWRKLKPFDKTKLLKTLQRRKSQMQ
ncbi:MAG: DUF1289 domain-containing protein [Myxococcota bacterium]|nr:DUF1289 domain-containing protein [Myxococcota bacterium]